LFLALEEAFTHQFPQAVQCQRLSLMSENGFQLISMTFMKACYRLSTEQTFTSCKNPKGNAEWENGSCKR